MKYSFTDMIALVTLLLWPAIPLFWVPVHCLPWFFRRLGLFTYILPVTTWLPLAFLTFTWRDFLLANEITLPLLVNVIGALVFLLGAGLQTWTLVLLTAPVIVGMPEVTKNKQTTVVQGGPFAALRHPTYLSHTLMLLGLFVWTEKSVLALITIIDAVVVNLMVIPLEERELLERFGKEYEEYRRKVPSRFLPFRWRQE